MCIPFILISFDVGKVPLLHVPHVRVWVLLPTADVLLVAFSLFLPLQVVIHAATFQHLGVRDALSWRLGFVLH